MDHSLLIQKFVVTSCFSVPEDSGSVHKRPVLVSVLPGGRAIIGDLCSFAQLQFAICCLSRTFDQRMFDFHGNCEYVLARGKMSRTDTFAVIVR